MAQGLIEEQRAAYDRDGFVVVRDVFGVGECAAFIEHMMDLHAGRKTLEGFDPRGPDDWRRTHNQHFFDERAMTLLLDARLRRPLADGMGGDEPEGVQTMYFYKGSVQARHQDQ